MAEIGFWEYTAFWAAIVLVSNLWTWRTSRRSDGGDVVERLLNRDDEVIGIQAEYMEDARTKNDKLLNCIIRTFKAKAGVTSQTAFETDEDFTDESYEDLPGNNGSRLVHTSHQE